MTHTAQQPTTPRAGDAGDALDAIVDELRVLLTAQHTAEHANGRSASVARWIETLLACITRCNNNDGLRGDDDDAEDVADVLVMVLSTCVQNAWRATRVKEENDPIGEVLFHEDNMKQLFKFIWELVSSNDPQDMAEQSSAALSACEVAFVVARLTQSESEINCMLQAWESSIKLAGSILQPLKTLQEVTSDQRLAICYVRFIDSALSDTKETIKQPSRPILSDFVGDDISLWREHNWEQKWQLISSVSFRLKTFGSENACEAMVKRILQGFSIPQVDADAVESPLNLPSFLLSLDLSDLLGLRHKVDVTLVRDGVTHPDWKLNDVLRFEDIMDAFRSHKYTIGIRGVHARSHLIANICNILQNELKQHVNANIYYLVDICARTGTPPGEQGFNLHIDDHCVFVIQLKGKKNWHLKDHVGDFPRLYSALSEPPASGPTKDLVLAPGGILYIPRGTPHCADTKGLEEDSIHLTIGVEVEEQFTKGALVLELLSLATVEIGQKYLDAIKTVMASASLRNEMRRGLMSWHLEDDNVFKRESIELLTQLIETLDAALVHEAALERERQVAQIKKLVDKAVQLCAASESKLSSLRQRLLKDRHAFLSSRQKLTTLFTRLHRALPSDDPALMAELDCSFIANKKIKR